MVAVEIWEGEHRRLEAYGWERAKGTVELSTEERVGRRGRRTSSGGRTRKSGYWYKPRR